MKMKLWLLLFGFTASYFIVHMAYDLPNMLSGSPRFGRITRTSLFYITSDLLISFFYSLIPFLALY